MYIQLYKSHGPQPHPTTPQINPTTEIRRLPGSATTVALAPGSRVAYVGQKAWIRNATLRDNVLFGLPYDAGTYQVCWCVRVCWGRGYVIPGLSEIAPVK